MIGLASFRQAKCFPNGQMFAAELLEGDFQGEIEGVVILGSFNLMA